MEDIMPNLSQVELQNLRHLIGAHETSYQKLNSYASQAVDPQIKQMFTKSAQALSKATMSKDASIPIFGTIGASFSAWQSQLVDTSQIKLICN